MNTQMLEMGPMAITPVSAATEMDADMYFCTIWNTINRKLNTGVSSDYRRVK
jgi:hypothetical protein